MGNGVPNKDYITNRDVLDFRAVPVVNFAVYKHDSI